MNSTIAPTIWICGLSQSGKSTLAEGVSSWLSGQNVTNQILDGRAVREQVGGFLGYSREERIKVGRIMAAMADMLNRNGVAVVATAITPYQESRDLNRASLERYIEVHMRCPVEVCIERDRTGNYQKALRGELRNFIGIDDPFEVPVRTDLVIDSGSLDIAACRDVALKELSRSFVQ